MERIDLFKLYTIGGQHKLELTLEPLFRNRVIDIDEKEYKKLTFKYGHLREDDRETYSDTFENNSYVVHMLRLELKKDFRKYYIGA